MLENEVRLQEVMRDFITLMTDFDAAYPELVQSLKDAGIDEYVAEVQGQVDAFLAQ